MPIKPKKRIIFMTTLTICPVCKSPKKAVSIAQRNRIPALQNVTLSTANKALSFDTVELEMLWCRNCSFSWNSKFEPARISYDSEYNNDVSASPYYRDHLDAMADRIIASVPANEPIHYVEVGCGEGDFINLVIERANGRCLSATGFDPSFSGQDKLNSLANVHTCYFGEDTLGLMNPETNVICSRHTIEHVSEPHGFVKGLASALTNPDRRLFLETPTLDWILETVTFQDFFYEHCSLFNHNSMKTLLAQHGLWAEIEDVYGGQYMWIEAGRSSASQFEFEPFVDEGLPQTFIEASSKSLLHWKEVLSASNKTAIWGAASKGVTFSLIMAEQIKEHGIRCAIDLNEAKQDCFLPITGIPIVSPVQAKEMGIDTVIVMNPNYFDEITAMIEGMDWEPKVMNFD